MSSGKRTAETELKEVPPPPGNRAVGKKKRGTAKFQKVDTLRVDGITFVKSNSAPQLVLSKDFKEVTGDKGYRMARTGHGVSSGSWYYECEILAPEKPDMPAHWRLGWSQKQGDVQAPVGYDRWSYAYRDLEGSKVHESVREDGWGEPYGPGDIIGFMICLPFAPSDVGDALAPGLSLLSGPSSAAARAGRTGNSPPKAPKVDPSTLTNGNHIRFFKNGKDLGVAFSQIPPGTYYPAVSLYMGARVRANFGPTWACEPTVLRSGPSFRPISDLRDMILKREELDPQHQLMMQQQAALQRIKQKRGMKARSPTPPLLPKPEPQPSAPTAAEGGGEEEDGKAKALPSASEGEEAEGGRTETGSEAMDVVSSSSPAADEAAGQPAPPDGPQGEQQQEEAEGGEGKENVQQAGAGGESAGSDVQCQVLKTEQQQQQQPEAEGEQADSSKAPAQEGRGGEAESSAAVGEAGQTVAS